MTDDVHRTEYPLKASEYIWVHVGCGGRFHLAVEGITSGGIADKYRCGKCDAERWWSTVPPGPRPSSEEARGAG